MASPYCGVLARLRRRLSMRHTLELLKQISLAPYASESTKQRAREAIDAMDRDPIADDMALDAVLSTQAEAAAL